MKLWQEIQKLLITQNARVNGAWIRTPTVLQMENTECGAASLSIILQHYGKYVPLTQLRELCGVSRDGSDAANLLLAGKKLDLKGNGYKKSLDALRKMKLPVILFWEFNHFLILEGFQACGLQVQWRYKVRFICGLLNGVCRDDTSDPYRSLVAYPRRPILVYTL